MRHCLAPFCPNRGSIAGVRYFQLTASRRDRWLSALGRQTTDEVSLGSSICSNHFAEEAFEEGTQKLKADAAPTLNLRPARAQLFFNNSAKMINSNSNENHPGFGHCAVQNCPFRRVKRPFHRFPHPEKFPQAFKIWLLRIASARLHELKPLAVYRNYVICDSHFSKYCKRVENNLVEGSLPTLHLPGFSGESNEINSRIELLQRSPDLPLENQCQVQNESRVLDETVEEASDPTLPSPQKGIFRSISSFIAGNQDLVDVCQICLRAISGFDKIRLAQKGASSAKLKDIIKSILPDFDFERFPNSVVCVKCSNLLTSSFKLRSIWQETQLKLQVIVEEREKFVEQVIDLVIFAEESTKEDREKFIFENDTNVINLEHDYATTTIPIVDANKKPIFVALSKEVKLARLAVVEETQTSSDNNLQQVTSEVQENSLQQVTTENVQVPQRPRGQLKKSDPDLITNKKQALSILRDIRKLGSPPHLCDLCGSLSDTTPRFRNHIKKHLEIMRDWICDKCGKTFRNRQALSCHLYTIHSKEGNYPCEICKKVFNRKHVLQSHIYQVHRKERIRSQCHICGAQLTGQNSYWMHMLKHDPDSRKYKCDLCPKRFVIPYYLKMHKKKHHLPDKLKCEYCDCSLKHEISLKRHIRVYHSGAWKHTCEVCFKVYWKKCDLVKHRTNVHSLET